MEVRVTKDNRFKEILSKRRTKRIILIIVFAILIVMSLFVGTHITLRQVINDEGDARLIFRVSRIPRTLAIILSASGLSVAGLVMQAISRNKFMAPSTSGANDAAMLGLLVGSVFLSTTNTLAITIFAFVFAFAGIMIFTTVINSLKIKDAAYIPLLGLMFGGLLSAITTAIAHRLDLLGTVTGASVASFNRYAGFGLIYIILIPLIIIVIFSHKLSIIGLGEDFAKNLGVNYNKVVLVGLACVSLVTAASFVSIGPLPFIGLLIPNLVSAIYGDNIKKSLWDLMIFGSAFLLLADIISRVILPSGEVSVGLTVSIVGGIVFITYILGGLRNGKTKGS